MVSHAGVIGESLNIALVHSTRQLASSQVSTHPTLPDSAEASSCRRNAYSASWYWCKASDRAARTLASAPLGTSYVPAKYLTQEAETPSDVGCPV